MRLYEKKKIIYGYAGRGNKRNPPAITVIHNVYNTVCGGVFPTPSPLAPHRPDLLLRTTVSYSPSHCIRGTRRPRWRLYNRFWADGIFGEIALRRIVIYGIIIIKYNKRIRYRFAIIVYLCIQGSYFNWNDYANIKFPFVGSIF